MNEHDPRTTAFVLGELDEEDNNAMRDLIERHPYAIEGIEEIRETSSLLQEALAGPLPLELTSGQRQTILNAIARPPRVFRTRRVYGAVAALVVFGVGTAALVVRDSRATSASTAAGAMTSQSPLFETPNADGRINGRSADLRLASTDANLESPPVRRPIVMLDRTGRVVREVAPPGTYHSFRLSPDGQSIAIDMQAASGQRDIWVRSLSGGEVRRLTAGGGKMPVWSPDGRVVVFSAPRGDKTYQINSDGSGSASTVAEGSQQSVTSWFPNGRNLVWQKRDATTGPDLWIAPLTGGGPRPLANSPSAELYPAISPDGRWIAYSSDESGRPEIYVRGVGSGAKYRVSVNGAMSSRWRADGSEMFYIAPGGQLMSVEVASKDDTFSLSAPRLLFRIPAPLAAEFEVTDDGQRFILFGGGSVR